MEQPAKPSCDEPDYWMNASARIGQEGRGGWLQIGRPKNLLWKRIVLPVSGLDRRLDGLRLVHLSDLHLRRGWAAGYDQLINRLRDDPPDLICFTGDFVEDKRDCRPAVAAMERLMGALPSRLGTFAVLGNHDNRLPLDCLARLNICNITNQRKELGSIELVGFGGVQRSDLDLTMLENLPPRTPGQVRIALCHYPDLFERINRCKPDLYLCGHCHGGQICLPGGVALLKHDRSSRRFVSGVHRRGSCWYVANRGVGAGKIMLRLFCPAEVLEITLRRVEQ